MHCTVSEEASSRERWDRRSILKIIIPLCTVTAGMHLSAVDSASEVGRTAVEAGSRLGMADVPARLDFQATAYCESGTTKSGVPASPGVVAADPRVLPLGSVIHVDVPRYHGIYEVMDTGKLVKGRIIDIFIPDYDLATNFGRRRVKVTVLRYGFTGREPQPVLD